MKFSEAIMLGNTVLRRARGSVYFVRDGVEFGCAIGMALKAADALGVAPPVIHVWPWLRKDFSRPCECGGYGPCNQIVVHLFDYHVICGPIAHRPWTLEQLVDWVRSVEPEEPAAVEVAPQLHVDCTSVLCK